MKTKLISGTSAPGRQPTFRFKANAKPKLPAYARSLRDIHGYVHDDGTIQPDIEMLSCYWDPSAHCLNPPAKERYAVFDRSVTRQEGFEVWILKSEDDTDPVKDADRPHSRWGQKITWWDLPQAVQITLRKKLYEHI